MTLQKFKKAVLRKSWYDKYYYYLVALATIIGSVFLFYDIAGNPAKYKARHSYEIALVAFSVLFLLGCYALYLIPNRYKVITITSGLPVDKKREIVAQLMKELGAVQTSPKDGFYSFRYSRKWWTSAYDIYIFIDNQQFYASVLSSARGNQGGFIDFGGTERLRKKVSLFIQSLADKRWLEE